MIAWHLRSGGAALRRDSRGQTILGRSARLIHTRSSFIPRATWRDPQHRYKRANSLSQLGLMMVPTAQAHQRVRGQEVPARFRKAMQDLTRLSANVIVFYHVCGLNSCNHAR